MVLLPVVLGHVVKSCVVWSDLIVAFRGTQVHCVMKSVFQGQMIVVFSPVLFVMVLFFVVYFRE